MSKVVIGVGASHTTLMNTRWDEVDHLESAHSFRDGLSEAANVIKTANIDLLVIVGTNHFRGFWLDLMPSITIGVGEVIAAGEHGTPSGPQPVDPTAALEICNSVMAADFDLTFSARLDIDHGISHAIQYLAPSDVPILPIVINTLAPPLASLRRCLALGDVLREAIGGLGGNRRVGVIGTGGLSHVLPFPDWRTPKTDDDDFLVESWLNGRGDWQQYEQRRRGLIMATKPQINPEFDRTFLDGLETGRLSSLPENLTEGELLQQAGIGGNEIRTWLTMAATCGHAPARTISYSPIDQWLTGMAVAVIDRPMAPNGAIS